MHTLQQQAMIDHCDKLVASGAKLSIYWNGGNDSGYFEMRLDDHAIEKHSELEEQIMNLVEEYLDYGSFDGDFSTDGEVIYNPEAKAFEGTDDYIETEGAERKCHIDVCLPKDIWFDRLLLSLNVTSDLVAETDAEIQVINGPLPPSNESIQVTLAELLAESYGEEADATCDFAGSWQTFEIPFKDFIPSKDQLVYVIDTFRYDRNIYASKDIYIPLQS